ncbi:MAG: tyrosine--tRNA ligase [archaeon]|nr:tyrosine--tRNA ligase [archaeon]
MDLEKKIDLVKEVGEEIITEEELRILFETKKKPIAYDGFEPSGKIHIAQGILRAINVNKMTQAGCKFKLWVADWHAWANNKLDGDLDNIKKAGEYMIEVWNATGMDMKNVEVLWASDVMGDKEYWAKVMKIATNSTLKRTLRCSQIMGRSESDILQSSQIFYPCMQTADIFHLNVDIAQLGMDQRKVNVFARELAPKLGFKKPIAVHHHMLMGLTPISTGATGIEKAIEMKMSKSKPNSAIFMTDSENEVQKKMNKAYCPEKIVEDNPVLEYCKFIVFEKFKSFDLERPEKFGGNISFGSYSELETAFAKGTLHPMDLKQGTSKYINELLEPVRKHFEKNTKAKKLLEKINSFSV